MTSMSCAPRSGGGEALASRDGVGFGEQPAGKLRPPRRLAAFSELLDGVSRPLYLSDSPSSCQQAASFPLRKDQASAPGASLDPSEHAPSPVFPNSKKFCTRLTDSRAPPSIAGSSAVERSLGKTLAGDFEGGA
jgi:hypothetical protein